MASILKVDTIQDQSGNNIINENADTITIGASGDTITIPSGATLTNNGTQTGLTLSDNILFNAASKGIYLGVTTATASNLLDDYEEGTWTATFAGSTYTETGYYTKIGNLVFVGVYGANFTTTSGIAANMGGLPFTVSSSPNAFFAGAVTHNTYCNSGGGNGYFANNTSTFTFILENSTSTASVNVGSGRYVMMAGCYLTS